MQKMGERSKKIDPETSENEEKQNCDASGCSQNNQMQLASHVVGPSLEDVTTRRKYSSAKKAKIYKSNIARKYSTKFKGLEDNRGTFLNNFTMFAAAENIRAPTEYI